MDQKAFLAISAMVNSFPQQGAQDSETLLRTYQALLRDCDSSVIAEAAERFMRGRVDGQSKTFCPSVAEFVTETDRIRDERRRSQERRSFPAVTYRRDPRGLRPFEVNAEKLRQKYASRPILAEGLSHDAWMQKARAGEFPEGHTWIAALNGTVFGPVEQHIEQEDAA